MKQSDNFETIQPFQKLEFQVHLIKKIIISLMFRNIRNSKVISYVPLIISPLFVVRAINFIVTAESKTKERKVLT